MWPALFSVLYTTAAPLRVVKSGLVLCVLSLVRCDSLYFSSLHFSSLSLRVVSHQRRSLSLRRVQCNTQVLTIKANFHPKPLQSPLARMLLFLARFFFFSFLFAFPFCCPPSCEKRRERQAPLVTVVPISGAKLRDHVWYCQMAWKIKNPIKVAVQRSAPLHIKSSPLAILHKLYPLTAHFA